MKEKKGRVKNFNDLAERLIKEIDDDHDGDDDDAVNDDDDINDDGDDES